MAEARKSDYFIDGFLIRHLGIFPTGLDKEDLFEEQRAFLVFLAGVTPSMELWQRDIEYRTRKEDIEKINVEDIELSAADRAVSDLHGANINMVLAERLISERKTRLKKLNEEYGIEDENEDDMPEVVEKPIAAGNKSQELWEILQGKGLVR